MRTKEQLQELSNAIGVAIRAYHSAVADNLKESGKEHNILFDDEFEKGLMLSVRNDNGDGLITEVIDKVRWNEEMQDVQYHSVEYNYKECDEWYSVSWLGEDADYIFEAIDWE